MQRCTTCGAAFDDSIAMCPRDGTPLFAAESNALDEQPAAAGQGVATLEELSDAISQWEHEEPEPDDPTQLMQIDDREAFERHAREAAAAAVAEDHDMIPESALEPIPAPRPGGGQEAPETQPMVDVAAPQRREPPAVPSSSGPPRPPRQAPKGSSPQTSPPAGHEPPRDAQQPVRGTPSHGPPQRAEQQGSSPPKTLHGFPGVQGPPAVREPGSFGLAESTSSAAFDPPGVEPQAWHTPEPEPVESYAPVTGSSERPRPEPTSDMELQPEDEVAEKKSSGLFAVLLMVGLLLVVALGGAYFYFQPLLEEGSTDDPLEPTAAVPVEEQPPGDELAVAEAEVDTGLEFEVDELEQGLELASVEAAALAERAVSSAELVVIDVEKARAEEAPPKRKKPRAKRRPKRKPKPKPKPKPAVEDSASDDDISIWGGSDDKKEKEKAPAKKEPAEKKESPDDSDDDSLDIW